jgi:6-phosphogluconolactonase
MPFVQGRASGIVVCRLDLASGALAVVDTVTGVVNPSYLALDPRQRALYAVEEHPVADRDEGCVSAFRVDLATGALRHLNRVPSHGAEPAHVGVDQHGRWVLVANYQNGSVAVFPILADGSLGPAAEVVRHEGSSVHPERQQGPHAHWIGADATNRFVLVSDLGLDAIVVYRFDPERGKLTAVDELRVGTPPGSGPRHVAFRPDGRYLYLVNELDSTFIVYAFDAESGQLRQTQHGSTLPEGYAGTRSIAAVRVAPSGRFVYVSNRGHDSIGIFASDPATGALTAMGHRPTQGRVPRDFNIDPTGRFLLVANQDSDTVVTFRIDQDTGLLEDIGQMAMVETPVCIAFGATPA